MAPALVLSFLFDRHHPTSSTTDCAANNGTRAISQRVANSVACCAAQTTAHGILQIVSEYGYGCGC